MTAHVLDRLSPYLDGELSPPGVTAVRAHLRDCSECARQLEELAAVDELARGLGVEAPGGYFESFPARLREKLPQRAPGPRRLPMWALAAAAVLVVAVITPLTLRQRSLGPSVAEMPQAVESPAAPSLAPQQGPDQRARGEVGAPPAREAQTDQGQPETKAAGGSDRLPAKTVSESVERDVLAKREAPTTPRPAPAPQAMGAVAPGQAPGSESGRPSAAAASRGGPWVQGQTQGQTPGAFAPRPSDQPADEARRNQRASEDRVGVESAPAEPEGGRVGARTTVAAREKAEVGFESLRARRASTATEARALSAAWRRFAAENPSDPRADEARVAAIEAGALAFRMGHEPADRAQVEADARAYLTRPDPAQADRVKALLASLERF